MGNNNDYTTADLLYFAYFKENYKPIAIDLSTQTKLKDPQQINFIGKLDEVNGATIFFYHQKIRRNYLKFFTKLSHNHINNGNPKICKFIKLH